MDVATSVEGQTGFTLDLYKAVVKDEGEKNAVLSPLSIGLTLAMAGAGAKGATLDQISSCLKLPGGDAMHDFSSQLRNVVLADGSAQGGPLVASANKVWVQQAVPPKRPFTELLKSRYGSEAGQVDFQSKAEEARTSINTWVKDETRGKIEDLLPPDSVDQTTRVVLVNALYFKGAWKKPFEESETKDGTFYLLDGKSVTVPMIRTQKKQFIKSFGSFKALRLLYFAGDDKRLFSMYFLLPNDRDGLTQLEQSLDTKLLGQDLSKIKLEVPVTNFQLPRFRISSGFEVPEALKTLGLVLPFTDDADFSELVDSPSGQSLYISNIFHKAFVEVNEKGTEAAAATGATITLRGLPAFERPEEFVADHPFLFVIKEELTNVILFIGRITNPIDAS